MGLAGSLLRIPDNKTTNELIEDKLQNKDWKNTLEKVILHLLMPLLGELLVLLSL